MGLSAQLRDPFGALALEVRIAVAKSWKYNSANLVFCKEVIELIKRNKKRTGGQ